MAGWLKGVVKEVLSGDSITIVGGSPPNGLPPPEKRLTLSSLVAPKLGKRDGTTKDEPFAWQSREWLRNKLIGKVRPVLRSVGERELGAKAQPLPIIGPDHTQLTHHHSSLHQLHTHPTSHQQT
jgi:hypothetical protein